LDRLRLCAARLCAGGRILAIASYAVFGIAMTRTATLARLAGIFVAVGGSAYCSAPALRRSFRQPCGRSPF